MNRRAITRARCARAGFGLLIVASFARTAMAQQSSATPALIASQQSDRLSVSLTVYNANFALVREARQLRLPAGPVRLAFEGVPGSIEPATVHLAPMTGVNVIEQSYEYDLVSPNRLLDEYVGKEMTLIFRGQQNGTTHDTDLPAVLLSTNGPVWKIGNEIVTGIQPSGYRFPELPGGLYNTPTLLWSLRSSEPARRTFDVSYLADQIGWEANYVLELTRTGDHGGLEGWITLTNNTNASFHNASLSLVAGDVRRATAPAPRPTPLVFAAQAKAAAAPEQFAQQPAGEYHLYQLNRRIDLNGNESKQISLLSVSAVPVTETYEVQGNSEIYEMVQRPGPSTPEPVEVYLSFRNDQEAGLGQPLPAGIVRVYQPDSQGNPIFLGEDRIDHTPAGESARLDIGNAFDITAERRQTDFRVVSPRARESSFEIILHNHKSQPVTVEVREPVGGSWELLSSNVPSKKPNAFTLEFDVPVPAGGSATLDYRVRVTD